MTSEERIEIIRKLTAEGLSCVKIAVQAECSNANVNRIQREKGFVKPKGVEKDRPTRAALLACNGMRNDEVCRHFGRDFGTVKKWMEHHDIKRVHNGPHTGLLIDLRVFKALAGEGLCAAHIAERMGLTPPTILKVARAEGIELARGDAQAGRRERPEKAEFAKYYRQYTLAELSSIYGVTMGTVSKWALHYGLREEAPKRRARLMSKDDCTRKIAGDTSPAAIARALAKLERRV